MQYPRRVEDALTPHPCDCAQSRLTRAVSITAVNFSRAVQPSAEFRPKLSGSAPSSGNRPPVRRAWWRFVQRRVLPPGGARFELHLVSEQKPDPHNRITLSPTEADVFGQSLARIHWQMHEDDCRPFSQIAELAFSQWAAGKRSQTGKSAGSLPLSSRSAMAQASKASRALMIAAVNGHYILIKPELSKPGLEPCTAQ